MSNAKMKKNSIWKFHDKKSLFNWKCQDDKKNTSTQ